MEINDKNSDERLRYDVDREAVKRSTLSGKSDNYEYLMDEEILHSNQRQIIKQAKFTYSFFCFWKTKKNNWSAGKKKVDTITNQNERLSALKNKDHHKDDHKDIYKKIFEKLVNEKFNEIQELTCEINHDNLMHYFECDTAKKTW